MYTDISGHMPEWAKWLVGGLAISGLVVATVLTCGVAGVGASVVGAAMLTGGVVSAGMNAVDQLIEGETFDWAELAISTISGTAYGLVVGATGGVGMVAGKFAVAGATSLLNSWNERDNLQAMSTDLGISLLFSGFAQGVGYGVSKLTTLLPKDPTKIMTMGDIFSYLWNTPAVKTGVVRFSGGVLPLFRD